MKFPSKSWKSFAVLKVVWCVFDLGIVENIFLNLTFFVVWVCIDRRFAQANFFFFLLRAVLKGATLLLLVNYFLLFLLLSFAFISFFTVLRSAAIFLLFDAVLLFVILSLILGITEEGIPDRFKETFLSATSAFIFNMNSVLLLDISLRFFHNFSLV